MPLKKKGKGKAKGKGKGKGKGKAKGGKKGSKDSIKPDKDTMLKEAMNNAKTWEMRFGAADKSRHEYRTNARQLITQNQQLQDTVSQTERDTIEVIAFLKKEDVGKMAELDRLKGQIKSLHIDTHREKEMIVEDYSQRVAQLEASLSEKDEEIRVIQGELKTVKEFRKRRGEMQQQIEQLQCSLEDAGTEHEKAVSAMEYKFFEEKLRLQKEANRRIADLAGRAHEEAINNVDERTRQVYHENMHMSNALALHMEHEETLQKSTAKLEMSNRQLVAEKELNQRLVKDKISQARKQKKLIKELQDKVVGLEQSLTMLVKEFEEEKHVLQDNHTSELAQTRADLVSLQHRYDLQDKEMAHVKRLARRILDQREEVELFFLEALKYVREEIATNRAQYCCDAQLLYREQMLAAASGRSKFPPVRTFKSGQDTSTNSVYQDMEQAKSWVRTGEKVEISDLTWEQKEQVLKLLFHKMNQSSTTPTKSLPSLPAVPSPLPSVSIQPPSSRAFITQRTGAESTHRRIVPGQAA